MPGAESKSSQYTHHNGYRFKAIFEPVIFEKSERILHGLFMLTATKNKLSEAIVHISLFWKIIVNPDLEYVDVTLGKLLVYRHSGISGFPSY